MKKKLFYTFIFVGIIMQFYVLTHNIVLHEMTLRKGEVCRFQTAPVDPFDAFRGQYVALDFNAFGEEGRRGYFLSDTDISGKWAYLQIGTDTNGFAVVENTSQKRDLPSPYLKVRISYCYEDSEYRENSEGKKEWVKTGKYRVYCHLPFTRYYMPEHLAPEAEKAYLEANRSGKRNAAAVVRVWKGKAVIEDLEIEGMPVREFLKKREAEKEKEKP